MLIPSHQTVYQVAFALLTETSRLGHLDF